MTENADKFEATDDGVFHFIKGPAYTPDHPTPCQWKLCITATDEQYLVEILYSISQREDCYYVKYSPSESPKCRDGMMLGRVFLTAQHKIGELWQQLYQDKKLFCSIQDDAAIQRFRG